MADTTAGTPQHVAPDEGEAIWFMGGLFTVKASTEMTEGTYTLVEQRFAPGFTTPVHVHHRDHEAFYVLEGEAVYRCGDRTFKVGPGSFVFLPRGIPHVFRVQGGREARLLEILAPGGGERFFAAAGEPAGARRVPPPGPPDVEKMQRAAQRHGIEILALPQDLAG